MPPSRRRFDLFFVAALDLRVPVAQPVAALAAQQVPVELHARERLVHPRGQLRGVDVGARGDAVVSFRRVDEGLGRGDELVEAFGLFGVLRAGDYRDAVGDDGRAARGDVVGDGEVALLPV